MTGNPELVLPSPVPAPPGALVGRERERAILRDALAAVLAGHGSLVLLSGEAGIGKSALAEALLADAEQRGALALVGRCYDLSETPPYGPWAEALARTTRGEGLIAPPDLGGAGAASQVALFVAVRDYLAALATRRPLVLLLEDLHWADPASLDLLRFLSRQLAIQPLLLLATYRADELTRRHPLYALLPLLVREAHATRLDLRPLDEGDLRALVEQYGLSPADEARLVAYLTARSEGNPFFAGELLRSLAEEGWLSTTGAGSTLGKLDAAGVPPLLRQVLDARVDRLGEEVRALLAIAAIIGQAVPLAVWALTAESDEEALLQAAERASEARLVTEDGDGIRFAHALIREALYEGVLPLRRRVLHRRVAEVLTATPKPDPDAVAHHFQQAGDDRVIPWLIAAGERAQRTYALLTAAARYEAALALLERQGAPAEERCWLLLTIARLRRYANPAGVTHALEEALALAREAGVAALVGIALGTLGTVLCVMGRWRAGVGALAEGVAAMEQATPADLARFAARSGAGEAALRFPRGTWMQQAAQAGHYTDVLAFAERWANTEEPPREPSAQVSTYADGWVGLGIARAMTGQPEAAEAAFARALETYQAIGHYALVDFTARAALIHITLPYRADQPAECERWTGVMAEAHERGTGAMPEVQDAFRTPLDLLRGRWDASSFAQLEATLTTRSRRVGTVWLSRRALARGERERAWTWVRQVLPDGPGTAPGDSEFHDATGLQMVAATLSLEADDLPTALDWLETYQRWLDWSGAVRGRAEGQLGWALYHRAAGDLAAARTHAERALAHATEPRQPLALLAAHRILGELGTDTGQYVDARKHLDTALTLAETCAAPYERALILLALAELHAATGEREQGTMLLTDAHSTFAALGAQPTLARADALAPRLSAPMSAPRSTHEPYPFGLTVREAEILGLVAQGLPNAEIAARLHLSHRTIEQHLRSVYNKLGVDNRTAATRLAIEHRLA